MGSSSEEFLSRLAANGRVLLLGGLAVIAHGLSRTTEDADIWLDSTLSVKDWIRKVTDALAGSPDIYFFDLLRREKATIEQLPGVIDDLGVVRIGGLDRYVDIFRKPNELQEDDFEAAWEMATPHLGEIRLLDETFLIVTKENSGRDRDRTDIGFLESKIRQRWEDQLPHCPFPEAQSLFSRYLDHVTCQAALRNPDPQVQALGLEGLRELAEGGNPFAIAALKQL